MKTSTYTRRYISCLLVCIIAIPLFPVIAESPSVNDTGFLYEELGGAIIITGYEGDDTDLTLPSNLDGMKVVGVRNLGIQSGIEHITIPDDVSIIGNPFGLCYALNSFEVSDSHPDLCLIDGVLFSRDKTRLICYPSEQPGDTYIIPNGTLAIGEDAFCDCPFLKTVQIPECVRFIGSSAFCFCSSLEELRIPSTVEEIGEMAFGNSAFRSMDFSSCTMITEIPDRLFYGCWQLAQVTLPPTIESIGDEAFAFSGLEEFTVPAGICRIGINPFRDCPKLHHFGIEEGIQGFDYTAPYLIDITGSRLVACIPSADTNTQIPDVAEIGDYCFNACDSVVHLTIPSSVVRIGAGAFSGCRNLEDVFIRDCSGLLIGRQAFSACNALISVTIQGDISRLEEDVFKYDDSLQEINATSEIVRVYCETYGLPFQPDNHRGVL